MTEASEPKASSAALERRIVTVLFADLVGFTTLSERLDAEDVAAIQDAYFASVRETVERYGGVVEKFIGDAAMAVFGAPRARDDDAHRAVRAGLALIGAVEQLGARLGLDPGELQLRVGVNSGEVVHAAAGPDAGRVTGDTVNTAARLQTSAEPGTVLLGELTALTVREAIDMTAVGGLVLKGKAEPVRAWRADGLLPEPSREAALGNLRAPTVGREADLERLAATAGGRVTVIAPPGVGKSRLVSEWAAGIARHRVLRARARPTGATPYEVVVQLLTAAGATTRLREALASTVSHPGRRGVIEREVAGMLEAPAAGTAAVQDLAAEREGRFAAWDDALHALAAGTSEAWIVEDVHWAGADLLAFLDHAAAGRRTIVCTARPSILDTAADWVAGAERLDLQTLRDTDASDLVRSLVGDALPETLVAAIAERSDGNPLFIEELVRTWVSVGTMVRDGDRWRLAVDPGAVSLPATVQAIYAAQLDDLPGDARLVARRASVAGRRFAEGALTPLELDDRRGGLDVLRRRAFVAGPDVDPSVGDVYSYRHALLRDAGYASLARAERSRLHAALARWLAESAGDRVTDVAQLVAEHYAAALESLPALGAVGRDTLATAAAGWFERAADAAVTMAAPSEALRLLDRAIELTEDAPLDRARRRMRRGTVMANSANLSAGIAELEAAVEILMEHLPASAALYADAVYALGLAYMQQIRFPETTTLARTALDRLGPDGEPAGRARLMALHAWSIAANGGSDGVLEEAGRARELGATVGDPTLEIDLLEHWAAVSDEVDSADRGAWLELEERASALGRWRQAVLAARIRGTLTADTSPADALPVFDDATELARAHALTEQEGWADLGRAETLMVLGDWDAALEAGERPISLGERYSYQRLTFRVWMVVLPMLAARRDGSWLPRYDAWWSGAVSHFPPTPSAYGTVLRAATRLWVSRARGEPFSGDIVLPDEISPYGNPHYLAAIEAIVEGLITAGDLERAAAVAGRPPEPDWTPLMRCSTALTEAWVAAARGDRDSAAAGAAEAAGIARQLGAAWWLTRALRVIGPSEEADLLAARLGVVDR